MNHVNFKNHADPSRSFFSHIRISHPLEKKIWFDKRFRIGIKSGKKNRRICEKSWKNWTCNWSGATHCRDYCYYKTVRRKLRGKYGAFIRNRSNNIRGFKHCFYTEKEKCESIQIFEPVVHRTNRVRILLECGERRRRKRLERSYGHSTDN